MKKLIIIVLMCYSPLFCGEWTQVSSLETSLVGPFIEAIDENNVMVSGNVGAIIPYVFKSSNKAENWDIILKDTVKKDENGKVIYHPKRVIDFEYIDSLHAFVLCEGLRYWSTEDGGKNWKYDSLLANQGGGIEAINFKNYVFTNYYDFYRSSDYGKTWETDSFKFDIDFDLEKGAISLGYLGIVQDTIIFADAIYSAGIYHEDNKYFIAKSTDLGRNWKVIYIKDYQYASHYAEVNGKIIAASSQQTKPYASSYRDLIRISEDGGYTWRTVMDTLTFPSSVLWDVEFINENDGITFSRDYDKLYRTSDGGETWYRDYGMQDFQFPPYDYEYLPNGEILAVARTGKVYKWTDPKLSVENDARPIEPKKEIEIYPNPVPQSQEINIKFNPTIYGFATISIVNILGKEISSYEVNLQARDEHLRFKPANDLARGSYFLQIEYRNGIVERQSFVVE